MGLFEYFFMFWLHRHLTVKQSLNSKQSTKVYERIIWEILRRSDYFKYYLGNISQIHPNKCIHWSSLTSLHISIDVLSSLEWQYYYYYYELKIYFILLYESVIFGITTSSSLEWFRKLWNLKWPPWERGNSII